MAYELNPFTGTLDIVGNGIRNANSTTYFSFDPATGTLSLYVNNVVRQTWTTTPVVGNGRRSSLWMLLPNISA